MILLKTLQPQDLIQTEKIIQALLEDKTRVNNEETLAEFTQLRNWVRVFEEMNLVSDKTKEDLLRKLSAEKDRIFRKDPFVVKKIHITAEILHRRVIGISLAKDVNNPDLGRFTAMLFSFDEEIDVKSLGEGIDKLSETIFFLSAVKILKSLKKEELALLEKQKESVDFYTRLSKLFQNAQKTKAFRRNRTLETITQANIQKTEVIKLVLSVLENYHKLRGTLLVEMLLNLEALVFVNTASKLLRSHPQLHLLLQKEGNSKMIEKIKKTTGLTIEKYQIMLDKEAFLIAKNL